MHDQGFGIITTVLYIYAWTQLKFTFIITFSDVLTLYIDSHMSNVVNTPQLYFHYYFQGSDILTLYIDSLAIYV